MFYGNLFNGDVNRLLDLSRSEILIYVSLISYGGKNRSVAASQAKISERAGVSLGSTKRALKKFHDLGWIASEEYYQVKKYLILKPQEIEEDEEQNDLDIGQHVDLDQKPTGGQHVDLPLDRHVDLPLDQDLDPHVIEKEKKNNIITLHDMTIDEKIFLNLLKRWKDLAGWKINESSKLLSDFRKMKNKYHELQFELELKMIDAWLLKQFHTNKNRVWKYNYMGRIESWFKRQIEQGARTSAALSADMRNYFQFAISDDEIPDPFSAVEVEEVEQRSEPLTSSKPLEEDDDDFQLFGKDKEFYDSLPKHEKWVIDGMGLQGLQALKTKYKIS